MLLAATLGGTLALTGCGDTMDDTAGSAGSSTSTTPAVAATNAGPTASSLPGQAVPETLRFTAQTIDGNTFDATTLAGKPTVLWFWAAWCPKCRAAADDVAAVQRDNAGKVNLVGVAGLGSGREAMRKFAKDTGIDGFPNLSDDEGAVWRRFRVSTQEYYVLLDSSGKVVHSGKLSASELRQRVAGLS